MGQRVWIGDGTYCYPSIRNNTSENFSDVCRRHCSYDLEYMKMNITVHSVLVVLSIVGNCILLSLFITKRRAMTRASIFIVNLCCADLCIALFVSLASSLEKLFMQFYGPELFCKAFKFLLVAPLYASAFSILAMGIDRYLAVFHPLLNYRRPLRQSLIIIGIVWSLALLSASPQLAFFAIVDISQCNVRRCIEVYDRYPPAVLTTYITWFCIVSYFLPALALLVIYSLICKKIWNRYESDKQIHIESPQPSESKPIYPRSSVVKFNSEASAYKNKSPETQSRTALLTDATSRISEAHAAGYKAFANRTKLRMLVMTAVIVALFVLWNAPYACSMIWLTLVDSESPIVRTPLFMICTTLANANATFNSWIYICFNRTAVCQCGGHGVSNTEASNVASGSVMTQSVSVRRVNGQTKVVCRSHLGSATPGVRTSADTLNGSSQRSSIVVRQSDTGTKTALYEPQSHSLTPSSSAERQNHNCATSSV